MTWQVIGHDWAVSMLRGHLSNGELRHAYLFTGPKAIGRRTLALRFAQAINCQHRISPADPCGKCRACVHTLAGQHPDLSIVQAEIEGGNLKVEQVRELQHTLSLAPYESQYRVALLLRFHEANINAQNALLKTLEEAPPKVVLFITADSAESLLPTIVSRCEVLRLRPMPIAALQSELQRRGEEDNLAHLYAHLAGGRLGYALQLIEDENLRNQRTHSLDTLVELMENNRLARFATAEILAKDKEVLRRMLMYWLSLWRDVLLLSAGVVDGLVNLDYQNISIQLATQLPLDTIKSRVIDFETALERLEHNVNPRMVVEVLMLDLPHLLSSGK